MKYLEKIMNNFEKRGKINEKSKNEKKTQQVEPWKKKIDLGPALRDLGNPLQGTTMGKR